MHDCVCVFMCLCVCVPVCVCLSEYLCACLCARVRVCVRYAVTAKNHGRNIKVSGVIFLLQCATRGPTAL